MTLPASELGTFDGRWRAPPAELSLSTQALHVWRATLPASSEQLQSLPTCLDGDELARAARFTRPRDCQRYLAWHGSLRRILARYLSQAPDRLHYVFGPNGKPSLSSQFEASGLRFNLAHSGDLALVAVALGRDVGVDIEQVRPLPDADSIAERHFSPSERRALAKLPAAERQAAFFNIWTCKEALIKATGQGLASLLSGFSVPVLSGGASSPLAVDAGAGPQWAVRSLAPGAGYAAAVVAEGLDWELSSWQF